MAEALTAPSRSLLASGYRRAGLQLRRELKRDFESRGTSSNPPTELRKRVKQAR